MPTSSPEISTSHRLARRLEEDIHRRGLVAGDRYLTAHEAAEMLGVSRATAQRAMKLMADSRVLLRRRSLGTFIGPGANRQVASMVRTVHILLTENDWDVIFSRMAQLAVGLREQLPSTNVNFGFIPAIDSNEYVKQLVKQARATGDLVGFVAISCPRETYQILAESGLPTVVYGSLYQQRPLLPSIDVDNREAGRLLARHVLGQGHRRMALLATSDGRPGDHDFLDGVSEALTAVGLPPNAMAMRLVPRDTVACLSVIEHLLREEMRFSAVIARGEMVASMLEKAVSKLGLRIPDQLELVYQVSGALGHEAPTIPYVDATLDAQGVGRQLGKMLKQRIKGEALNQDRLVVPVRFNDPRNASRRDDPNGQPKENRDDRTDEAR